MEFILSIENKVDMRNSILNNLSLKKTISDKYLKSINKFKPVMEFCNTVYTITKNKNVNDCSSVGL